MTVPSASFMGALQSPALGDLPTRTEAILRTAADSDVRSTVCHSLHSAAASFPSLQDLKMKSPVIRKSYARAGLGDWGTVGSKVFGDWRNLPLLGAGFGKMLDLKGSTGSNVVSSKLPEAQGVSSPDIAPSSEVVRLPSADVLSALKVALSSFILEPNVTEIRPVEALRKGCLIQNKRIYRQAFVIRYSEVGADKAASIETVTNLFQEVALNHVLYSGIGAEGFGTTKAMFECGLIWVVRRMHVEVDQYPAWGSMIEIDSWVASHGQASHGMRRDWIARDLDTRRVIARGTSQWVLMNMQTRRMARMPSKVREEITPFFNDKHAISTEVFQKIRELDESATYVQPGLKPHRNDLDLNQHVNNVKYIPWILESVPSEVLDASELKSLTMEYRRECHQQDIVVSLTSPEDTSLASKGATESSAQPAPRTATISPDGSSRLWHTLRKDDGSVIITAKTVWAPKGQR